MGEHNIPKGCKDRYEYIWREGIRLRKMFNSGNKTSFREELVSLTKEDELVGLAVLASIFQSANLCSISALSNFLLESA